MANGQANGQNPSQPQQPDFFHDLAAGKIPDPLAPKTSGTAAPTAAPKTSGTTPTPAPAATSDLFHDLAAGKNPDPLAQTSGTPIPSGDIIDRAVAGTFLEPINRGIEQGVAAGFGLKAPDPNHPESLTFADAAKQTWNNLSRSASRSYEKLGGLQPGDTEWDEAPLYRLDIPVHSALAAAATPFHMAAMGIDGMASLLEEGGKEFINGIKTSDHQTAARGFGKVLASLGQIAAGAEAPEAAGKAVGTVGKMAEYNPREVQGSTLTGAARPANVMQGAINRSVGAFGRDVRFGDPSRALIEEGVAWPGTKGRL